MLVDFLGQMVRPCKMIAPILDEVAGTYDGKLQVAKLASTTTATCPPASAASPR